MAGQMVSVKIEGLRETQEALRSMFPDAKARTIIRRVLRKRAKPIEKAAIGRAPIDPAGVMDLKRSIATSGTLRKSQRADENKADPHDVSVYVGVSTRHTRAIIAYAHIQEFGSRYVSAQPYMRPAWDAHRANIVRGIGADVWNEIQKTLDRAARKAAKIARGG